MQVEGNITSAQQTSVSNAVARETPHGGNNGTTAEQPGAVQQQENPLDTSIASMLRQDGVVVSFSIDKESGKFVVKIVNPFTNQVIRQVPPSEIATLATSIQQTAGILIDKKA